MSLRLNLVLTSSLPSCVVKLTSLSSCVNCSTLMRERIHRSGRAMKSKIEDGVVRWVSAKPIQEVLKIEKRAYLPADTSAPPRVSLAELAAASIFWRSPSQNLLMKSRCFRSRSDLATIRSPNSR
jgi:hypothetical protein